jgi:hypothetical protein
MHHAMSRTPPPAHVLPLRPHAHEDAARMAITWLAEHHRKGWRNWFEALAGPAVSCQLLWDALAISR